MPLLPFQHTFIDEPIRPITINGVLFQRLIRYVGLNPYQDPDTGEMSISLKVQVRHYLTNENGTAGSEAFSLVPNRIETFRTNNTEVIDLATGATVLTLTVETPAVWGKMLSDDPRNLLGRGDAYEAQMHSGPVDMVPQIREAMRAADAAPFYRFGGRPE
jgi:hypothetical protein